MHSDESITASLLSPTIIAGQVKKFEAEVIRRTKTYAFVEVRAYDGDRTLCALVNDV